MTNLIGNRLSTKARAGMMFVGQSGSRIDRYEADGSEPTQPFWAVSPFEDAENQQVAQIFETAARKVALAPDEYKIFFDKDRVLIEVRNKLDRAGALHEALSRANAEIGTPYRVAYKPFPTMRENKVPYIQFGRKATKGTGARMAVEALIASGQVENEAQVLILGDDFTENDLYMAQELPGAIAVSVGKESDPTQANILQAQERGAATVHKLLGMLVHRLEQEQGE